MNYKQLLLKYMVHVHQAEESTFLRLIHTPFSSVQFSDEEIQLLKDLEHDIEADQAYYKNNSGEIV